ncbi:MAG: 50S ribosomal protein L10, partial [Actinobacteria bacterium]|nr:50S ribosomal protein L10 [Actinomycetota bacterium]
DALRIKREAEAGAPAVAEAPVEAAPVAEAAAPSAEENA